MHLGIISSDPIQSTVLAGAARRRGWKAVCSESVRSFAGLDICPDAIVVDFECIDERVREDLAFLPADVVDRPVFVLAERAEDAVPELELLRFHTVQLKPFHPAELLHLIEAAVPGARFPHQE